jgi:hypothetical protein
MVKMNNFSTGKASVNIDRLWCPEGIERLFWNLCNGPARSEMYRTIDSVRTT